MKTSEVRPLALRIAVEVYEAAEGDLLAPAFNITATAERLGITDRRDLESVWAYLASKRIMERPFIGDDLMRFTGAGIAAIEASWDDPTTAHEPFPPFNLVFGNVGSGAQIAIGSGSSFSQNQTIGLKVAEISELIRLARSAIEEWPAGTRLQVAGAQAAIECEAAAPDPDLGFIRTAAIKLAKIAGTVAQSIATDALLSYLRAIGFIWV